MSQIWPYCLFHWGTWHSGKLYWRKYWSNIFMCIIPNKNWIIYIYIYIYIYMTVVQRKHFYKIVYIKATLLLLLRSWVKRPNTKMIIPYICFYYPLLFQFYPGSLQIHFGNKLLFTFTYINLFASISGSQWEESTNGFWFIVSIWPKWFITWITQQITDTVGSELNYLYLSMLYTCTILFQTIYLER